MASKISVKILDAAMRCFAESGLHGCTTKMISTRADCTEGSLFRLFGSKDKLFEAAIRRSAQHGQLPTDELARILENDDNFARALKKGMVEFVESLSDEFVRIAYFACLERPEIASEYVFTATAASRTLAHVIEREIYRGKLRDDIAPMTAALALIASLWQFVFIAPALPAAFRLTTRESRRSAVKNFVEIWYSGMQKP